jgi:hypothetical protein
MVKFSHPYVDLEIEHCTFEKHPNGIVQTLKESTEEVFYDYNFVWKYKLTIKNNSTEPVYYIKFEEKSSFLYIYPELKKTTSLEPNQELELNCIIRHSDVMKGKDSFNELQSFPYFASTIKIVLHYKNERHKSFYTTFIYDNNGQKNKHKRIK